MSQKTKVSRRTFLAGAAALGAAVSVAGISQQANLQEATANDTASKGNVEVKHAWCQMCGPACTYCSTTCYVKDGVWTNVEGNPEAGNNWGRGSRSLCAKGNAAMSVVYSPNRLLYPMKRVGEKGEGKFERCTWEEAMSAIAAKLKEQKEKYGAKTYGVLSPQGYPVCGTFGRRFLDAHGSPNYLHSAICKQQRAFSKLVTIGGKGYNSTDFLTKKQLDKTKLYVAWGWNSENSEINQGDPFRRADMHESGHCQTIDIRPMMDGLGKNADIWVPIRPGTDTALAMAILNVIIYEDLYDHDFVENWTYGFDELKEHLKDNTPAWAAEITGVSEEQIYEIARLIGTVKPMAIQDGNGIGDEQNDGHWGTACISLISAITGNLGIPGGGAAPPPTGPALYKLNAVKNLRADFPSTPEDEANGWRAGSANLVRPEFPRWFQKGTIGPNSTYYGGLESIITEKPYPMRFIFGQSSNPLSATRGPKMVEEALRKLDFYVVMDTYWNSSCDFADYVLPAAAVYETSDQIGIKNTAAGTFVGINQKIVEPMGESRSDWHYYIDLAERMGYGDKFFNGDMDNYLNEQVKDTGVTLEELRNAPRGIFFERTEAVPESPAQANYAKMFESLPDGKVQCYNSTFEGKLNAMETEELSPLPVYYGPAESHYSTPELAEEYPLVFSDVHAFRLCNHSYYSDIPHLRERQRYPWMKINPATAKTYGINDGDWVKVESPHGWIKLVAEYKEGIAPGVVMARRGWAQKCDELGLEGYGYLDGGSESTHLYDHTQENYDPFISSMSKQTLVKISKLEGGK